MLFGFFDKYFNLYKEYDLSHVKLYTDEFYAKMTPEEREKYCNHCGSGDGILNALVSDDLYNLGPNIAPCCDRHDIMYTFPKKAGIEYKHFADRVFRNNIIRYVEAAHKIDIERANKKSKFIRWFYRRKAEKIYKLRLDMAQKYYEAVDKFGGPSFWKGKNKPSEMKEE